MIYIIIWSKPKGLHLHHNSMRTKPWDATCGTSRDIQVPFVWRIHCCIDICGVCVYIVPAFIWYAALVASWEPGSACTCLFSSLGKYSPTDPAARTGGWRAEAWESSSGMWSCMRIASLGMCYCQGRWISTQANVGTLNFLCCLSRSRLRLILGKKLSFCLNTSFWMDGTIVTILKLRLW